MVSIIFTDDEIPVVKAYFDGTPRDDVAKSCGKSNGGVSNIWSKLENVAGPKIGGLRDLEKALDKDGASLQNALEGAEIWALCQKLGVKSLADLKEFVVGVYQRSVETGEQPNDIADMALRLKKSELKAGKNAEEVLKQIDEKIEERQDLELQNAGLRAETAVLQDEKEAALKDRDVTLRKLNDYCTTREELGEDLFEDVSKLKNMLRNARNEDYDVPKIVRHISQIESVSDQLSAKRAKLQDMDAEESKLAGLIRQEQAQLRVLDSTRKIVEAEIRAISDTAIAEVRRVGDSTTRRFETFASAASSANADILGNMSKLDTSVGDLREVVKDMAPAVERVSKSQDVFVQLGRFEAAQPIFQLWSGEGDVPRVECINTVIQMVERFVDWLRIHPLSSKEDDGAAHASLAQIRSSLLVEISG